MCEHGLVDTRLKINEISMDILRRIQNFDMAKDDGSALQCAVPGTRRQSGICPVGE